MMFRGNDKRPKRKDVIQDSAKLRKVLAQATRMGSAYDPHGSYTGRPVAVNEKPVQDADDL